MGHFALGIFAGPQGGSCFPSRLGLSFAEEKVPPRLREQAECRYKKQLVTDLEGKRGRVSFRQEEHEP